MKDKHHEHKWEGDWTVPKWRRGSEDYYCEVCGIVESDWIRAGSVPGMEETMQQMEKRIKNANNKSNT